MIKFPKKMIKPKMPRFQQKQRTKGTIGNKREQTGTIKAEKEKEKEKEKRKKKKKKSSRAIPKRLLPSGRHTRTRKTRLLP